MFLQLFEKNLVKKKTAKRLIVNENFFSKDFKWLSFDDVASFVVDLLSKCTDEPELFKTIYFLLPEYIRMELAENVDFVDLEENWKWLIQAIDIHDWNEPRFVESTKSTCKTGSQAYKKHYGYFKRVASVPRKYWRKLIQKMPVDANMKLEPRLARVLINSEEAEAILNHSPKHGISLLMKFPHEYINYWLKNSDFLKNHLFSCRFTLNKLVEYLMKINQALKGDLHLANRLLEDKIITVFLPKFLKALEEKKTILHPEFLYSFTNLPLEALDFKVWRTICFKHDKTRQVLNNRSLDEVKQLFEYMQLRSEERVASAERFFLLSRYKVNIERLLREVFDPSLCVGYC